MSAGNEYSSAMKSDDTLWMWGRIDFQIELGDGSTASSNSPVQIGGAEWSVVSAGHDHVMAVKK